MMRSLTPVSWHFDDFSEDIVENRVTRAAYTACITRAKGGSRRTATTDATARGARRSVRIDLLQCKMVDSIYFTRFESAL